jgi:hypothetical protein
MWLFYFTLFSAETSFIVLVYEVSDDGLQMFLFCILEVDAILRHNSLVTATDTYP